MCVVVLCHSRSSTGTQYFSLSLSPSQKQIQKSSSDQQPSTSENAEKPTRPVEPYRRMLPGLKLESDGTSEAEGETSLPTPRKNRMMNFKIPLVNRGGQRRDQNLPVVTRRRLFSKEEGVTPTKIAATNGLIPCRGQVVLVPRLSAGMRCACSQTFRRDALCLFPDFPPGCVVLVPRLSARDELCLFPDFPPGTSCSQTFCRDEFSGKPGKRLVIISFWSCLLTETVTRHPVVYVLLILLPLWG